jgi:hypothetical protein
MRRRRCVHPRCVVHVADARPAEHSRALCGWAARRGEHVGRGAQGVGGASARCASLTAHPPVLSCNAAREESQRPSTAARPGPAKSAKSVPATARRVAGKRTPATAEANREPVPRPAAAAPPDARQPVRPATWDHALPTLPAPDAWTPTPAATDTAGPRWAPQAGEEWTGEQQQQQQQPSAPQRQLSVRDPLCQAPAARLAARAFFAQWRPHG